MSYYLLLIQMNTKISPFSTIINNTYVRISYSSKEPNATVFTNLLNKLYLHLL